MNNYSNNRRVVNDNAGLNQFLTKMYGWMSIAVLISAVTAYYFGNVLNRSVLVQNRWLMWGSLILWFIMPLIISVQAMKRPTLSFVILMLYSVISGVFFSSIFVTYTGTSIAAAFLFSSVIFITMTIYGLVTKRNLARLGAQALAALIALIVAMVINLFLHSSLITLMFSFIAVIIFTILTAYDTQRSKNMYNQYAGQVSENGLAVYGALQLYLDFVNLFLNLLSIFGYGDNK